MTAVAQIAQIAQNAEFESAVEETHSNNEHGVAYKKEIVKVKILFEREGE